MFSLLVHRLSGLNANHTKRDLFNFACKFNFVHLMRIIIIDCTKLTCNKNKLIVITKKTLTKLTVYPLIAKTLIIKIWPLYVKTIFKLENSYLTWPLQNIFFCWLKKIIKHFKYKHLIIENYPTKKIEKLSYHHIIYINRWDDMKL